MKNNGLFIVCFLMFSGVYAQQGNSNTIDQNIDEVITTSQILTTATYTLAYPLEEYETMITRCKELTSKLISHDKLVQTGSMTKAQIKEWKRDVLEAKLLNYRIDDYTAMYQRKNHELSEYIDQEIINNYEDFSKTLDSAIQYAGF